MFTLSLVFLLYLLGLSLFQRGTALEEVLDKQNNQPNIIFLKDDDEEDERHQLFVVIEQEPMLETSNVVTSIFLGLIAHYVFNLAYHLKTGDVWLFIQERIAGLPSKSGTKRYPSSASHFTGIQRMYNELIK